MATLGVAFDYADLRMGMIAGTPEPQWLEGQPPGDRASYLEVRAAMEEAFLSELSTQLQGQNIAVVRATGGESHQLVVHPTRIEMGFYRVFAALDSLLEARLAIGPNQDVSDEISTQVTWAANMRNATIADRMNRCAGRTAQILAAYMRHARALQ